MAYSTDIKDYYRRAWGLGDRVPFKYGGTWADWKVNYEDQMSFEEYLQDDNIVKKLHALDKKADGGKVRKRHAIGLAIPIYTGLATLAGITINAAQNYLNNNPAIYNKLASNFDGNMEKLKENISRYIPGIHGPKDKEIVDIEKIKVETFPKQENWADSFGTGEGTKIPEQKKAEPPVSGDIVLPPQTGGSEIPETKKEDLIFYIEKVEDIKDPEAKQTVTEVLEKQKKEIPKLKTKEDYEKFIRGIEDVKVNTKYKPVILNKEYLGVLKEYTEKFHDSNIKNASINLPIEATTLSDRLRGIDFKGKGNIQTLSVEKGTLSLTDALNKLQDNNEESVMEINERLENSGISLNDYAHLTDLANLIGMDGSNADHRNALGKIIRTLGVKKEGDSKRSRIDVGDFLEKINLYATQTRKNVSGEGVELYKKYKSQLDTINPGLRTVHSTVRNHIRRKLDDAGLKLKDEKGNTIALGEDTGHVESLALISNYPDEFKGSNAKSLQTNVDQDPVVNRDILVNRGYHSTNEGILKDFKDKKITITEVNERLKANHDRIVEIIQETAKELPHFKNQEKRIALLQMNKNGVINADMSTVDKNYISGNINKINPKATKVSDLSKEEKAQYVSNIVDQYVDNAYNFLIQMKDDAGNPTYSRNEIADFLDMFYTPIGLGKKQYRIQRSKGGPIGLTGVDQYLLNRYK